MAVADFPSQKVIGSISIFSTTANQSPPIIPAGWTQRGSDDLNAGRHDKQYALFSGWHDRGHKQRLGVTYQTVDGDLDTPIITDIVLRKDGDKPAGYEDIDCADTNTATGFPCQTLNQKTGGSGCALMRLYIKRMPLYAANTVIADIIVISQQYANAPAGYSLLAQLNVNANGGSCGGDNQFIFIKKLNINYLRDFYCLPAKGTNMESDYCGIHYKMRQLKDNPALWHSRITEYCGNDRGDAFRYPDGICRQMGREYLAGELDAEILPYCQDHVDDPYCGCSPVVLGNYQLSDDLGENEKAMIRAQPQCFMHECSTSDAYRWFNLLSRWESTCPDLQSCKMVFQNIVNSDIKNVRCEQNIIKEREEAAAVEAAKQAAILAEIERKAAEERAAREAAAAAEQLRLEQERAAREAAAAAEQLRLEQERAAREAAAAAEQLRLEQERAAQTVASDQLRKQYILPELFHIELHLPEQVRSYTDQLQLSDDYLLLFLFMLLILVVYVGVGDNDDVIDGHNKDHQYEQPMTAYA